jgi:hypothetical protein
MQHDERCQQHGEEIAAMRTLITEHGARLDKIDNAMEQIQQTVWKGVGAMIALQIIGGLVLAIWRH